MPAFEPRKRLVPQHRRHVFHGVEYGFQLRRDRSQSTKTKVLLVKVLAAVTVRVLVLFLVSKPAPLMMPPVKIALAIVSIFAELFAQTCESLSAMGMRLVGLPSVTAAAVPLRMMPLAIVTITAAAPNKKHDIETRTLQIGDAKVEL
jgi:hypothetical protein